MKSFDTLIRLHKRTLDELRRQMVSLETQKQQLEFAIERLQQELENEVRLAGEVTRETPEMANFFGEFAKRIKLRQDLLREEICTLDAQILKLNEEIFDAFTELKKMEIARDNAKQRAKENAARKEAIDLDDIAVQQYIRKQDN
jgi:chromosome segregation ATPase